MIPSVMSRADRKIEAVHVNEKYKVNYEKDVFQKFSKIKEELVKNKQKDFFVNVRTVESEKLILHMGEGPSLINVTADRALYIGGIAVLPNRHVLLFD